MMKRHSHLSDERLAEMCLDAGPGTDERRHLDVCLACEARRAGIARMLEDCSRAATADADAAFPAERLARQTMSWPRCTKPSGRSRPCHSAKMTGFPSCMRGR